MVQNVFVLGLPGSGKSTALRHIEMLARDYHRPPNVLQDYRILYDMFQADREGIRFSSTLHDGFDVHNFSACNDALTELARCLREKERTAKPKEVSIIEFARDDYCKALEFFASLSLAKAFFLFIDAEIETCKQRIKARVANPRTPDDHYVSEYIFEAYYNRDHQQYMTEVALQLKQQFGVPIEHIQVIRNGSEISVQQFYQAVESFANDILKIRVKISPFV
jgi:hypothetical protein